MRKSKEEWKEVIYKKIRNAMIMSFLYGSIFGFCLAVIVFSLMGW